MMTSGAGSAYWRSLKYFSYYRLIVAGFFLGAILLSDGTLNLGSQNPRLFYWTCIAYLAAGMVSLAFVSRVQYAFNLQLSLQVMADITMLTLLMYASGGMKSGIAMMLLVVLMGAGLVGQGRMVLFYAALASVSLLLEQSYRVAYLQGEIGDFFRIGLTSIGFFGSATAARLLARRVMANEELAYRRGIELADQLGINERVIRDMQVGVLVIDPTGRVRLSNPQAAELLGHAEIAPGMLATSPTVVAKEYFRCRSVGRETELVVQIPQSGRTVRARFLPPGEGGNSLIFLEDVSRLQQEAQQVKLAALGRLTANMAHEIRNPLSAISHAAELLAEEPAAGTGRLIQIIGDNTERLNRLVREVMELGRRDRSSPEPVDLHEFLPKLIEEFSLQVGGYPGRISLELAGDAVVSFDRGHLHRVITNLIDNALHYASMSAGAVQIAGEPDKMANQYLLHVIDDGQGIDEAARGQIFEPFFTTRGAGTGLGLYIARELCEANAARLSLHENAPGAHFCISCASTWQDQTKIQIPD